MARAPAPVSKPTGAPLWTCLPIQIRSWRRATCWPYMCSIVVRRPNPAGLCSAVVESASGQYLGCPCAVPRRVSCGRLQRSDVLVGQVGSGKWNGRAEARELIVEVVAAQVEVETEGDEQRVRFVARYPGKLLLHWGVEGGEGYEGGWRLPGEAAWPPGTRSYKGRALQTPMQCAAPPPPRMPFIAVLRESLVQEPI